MVVASIRTRIDIPGCPSKTVAPLNLLSGYILVLPICTSFDLSRSKLLMYSSILVSFPGKSGKGGHSYALIKCCCFVLLLLLFFLLYVLPSSHVVRDRFYISYTRWGICIQQPIGDGSSMSRLILFEQIHPRHGYTAENDETNLYAVWKGEVTRVSAWTHHSETYMYTGGLWAGLSIHVRRP